MNDEINFTKSKIVNNLIQAVIDYDIKISPLPSVKELEEVSLREVVLQIKGQEFRCITDNEYGDMDIDSVPLQLNAILIELDEYEDIDDYIDWTIVHALNPESVEVRQVWDDLQKNNVEIRKIIPLNIKPISTWDWQLNAGDAQIIRSLPRRYARPDNKVIWLEIWINPHNNFQFLAVECFQSLKINVRHSSNLKENFAIYENYDQVLKLIENQGFLRVEDTLFPEKEIEGQIIKTGEWFEYWYHDLSAGEDIVIVRQIEGEDIQVFPMGIDKGPVIIFEAYELACEYLWQEDFVMSKGRNEL